MRTNRNEPFGARDVMCGTARRVFTVTLHCDGFMIINEPTTKGVRFAFGMAANLRSI